MHGQIATQMDALFAMTPALENAYYPNPRTIAMEAHKLVKPGGASWVPDEEHAALAYQKQFRGPF